MSVKNVIIKYMNDYIIGIARAYPLIIILSSFLSYFLTFEFRYFMLGIALLANDISNCLFKNIIQKIFGDKIIGLLGKRPIGAKNCGFFYKSNNSLSKSYGMPSGHSQNAAFFSTYTILNILDSNISKRIKLFSITLSICLPIGIMYSRVYLNCHTVQQVIIGGIISSIGLTITSVYLGWQYTKRTVYKK